MSHDGHEIAGSLPDLGNDLDLYTTSDERSVNRVMLSRLGAHTEPRSWGDRLANKWNFVIPGLPESVEVHAQRLGQTGEQTAMAKRFITRRVPKTRQRVNLPGAGRGGAGDRRHSAAHVPAFLFARMRCRQHGSAAGVGTTGFRRVEEGRPTWAASGREWPPT